MRMVIFHNMITYTLGPYLGFIPHQWKINSKILLLEAVSKIGFWFLSA